MSKIGHLKNILKLFPVIFVLFQFACAPILPLSSDVEALAEKAERSIQVDYQELEIYWQLQGGEPSGNIFKDSTTYLKLVIREPIDNITLGQATIGELWDFDFQAKKAVEAKVISLWVISKNKVWKPHFSQEFRKRWSFGFPGELDKRDFKIVGKFVLKNGKELLLKTQ